MNADLTIIATRRPDLLVRMLDSFSRQVFPQVRIENVIVNIDPVFGTVEDQEASVSILRRRFPQVEIFAPERPGFAAGIARVWRATTADYVLHTEEDWFAERDAGDFTAPFLDRPKLAQVVFYIPFQQEPLGIRRKVKRRTIAGLPLPSFMGSPTRHIDTSPSLMRGVFVRKCAELMNPALDPERQFCGGLNVPLQRYAAKFDGYVHGPDGEHVLSDMGREWLRRRGVKKQIVNGVVSWPTVAAD
jgi:hypothetical protein